MCPHPRSVLLVTLAALAVGSCAVGPDFQRPQPPAERGYLHPAPTPGNTDPQKVQRLNAGADIAAHWWQLFHSQPLDEVVRAALAGSPTLAAADATLAQ